MTYTCIGILFRQNRKDILTYATSWMDLEDSMLSKINQSQDKCCMIPLIQGSWNSQIRRDGKQNSGFQGLGEGRMGRFCLMGIEFQLGKMKRFVEMHGVMSPQQCKYT